MFLVLHVLSVLKRTLLDINLKSLKLVLCCVETVKHLPVHHPMFKLYFNFCPLSWFIGCFWLNGSFKQFFSLKQAVSQRL